MYAAWSVHIHGILDVAQLTLTSQPQTSGTYCPGPVTFTCVGTRINALIWLVNDSIEIAYAFQATDMFPLPLNFHVDGVMAVITSASFNPPAYFDITSILNVSNVSVLNRTSLQCETSVSQSEIFQIKVNSLSKLHMINYLKLTLAYVL